MSESTLADITTRVNAVDDTSVVLTSYYRSDVLVLLAYVRELRAALEDWRKLAVALGHQDTIRHIDGLLARYPEEPSHE